MIGDVKEGERKVSPDACENDMNKTEGQWTLTDERELLDYYDASFAAAYRCAARLTHGNAAAAEDLVQDAYARLVRAVRSGELQQVTIGWVIATIRHRFIDGLRSEQRESRRIRLVAVDPVIDDRTSSNTASILDRLSERERAALIFRYVDDLPVGEVADLLGVSVRATESLLQRAKRKARATEKAS